MSNATYNRMWEEAMAELGEQACLEDYNLNVPEGEKPTPPPQASIVEAFQHFACLYIKYVQIFKRLEECYDGMVHPQKRSDVKRVLQYTIRRIIELKHALVKWNPPNPDMRKPAPAQEEAFPWEYVNLDDIIVDLKLRPETLEVNVPRYFKDDNLSAIQSRDKQVRGYLKVTLGLDAPIPVEDTSDNWLRSDMTIDEAIEIIQRNERGRQGKQRAQLVREFREEEKRRKMYDTGGRLDLDPESAAAEIQRIFRGLSVRSQTEEDRNDELVFVGMKPPKQYNDGLEKEMELAHKKRKQEQAYNKEAFERDLIELQEVVEDEEGPDMRDSLREERTQWVTDQIAADKFPDDLADFYLMKNPPPPEPKQEEPAAGKGKKGEKGDKKGKKDEKKGKKDEKKGGKGKDKKGVKEELPPEKPPPLQQKTELNDSIWSAVEEYDQKWKSLDETENFAQRHDVNLAKNKVRPDVEEQIRKQVDEMLLMNLQKIKLQIMKAAKAKKGKGKGKKGKGKGKKGKGKKGKPLPGEKIAELKNMDPENMLSMLVENKVVNSYRNIKMTNLLGEFNYLGSLHHYGDRKGPGKWEPQQPSMPQLRQLITEYCILPLGDPDIKPKLDPSNTIKSIMFFGPRGSGKTTAVEAVANELGALLINISPSKLQGLFPGKQGPTKLVHLVWWVARYMPMAPVIIYMDDCELFFQGGGKKAKLDKEGPTRFQKDLQTYMKLGIGPEHRIMVMGTTRHPEVADIKQLRTFFDKFLYFPYPEYPSRLMLWKKFMKDMLGAKVFDGMEKFDFNLLAQISEGYTGGAIQKAIKRTLTPRRMEKLEKQPLREAEFINALANQEVTYKSDELSYRKFLGKVTGLDDRKEKLAAPPAEKGDAKGKAGAKKKK